MKLFNALSIGLLFSLFSFIGPANGTLIALDDWWLQSDEHGGLRQSTYNENVYFAVAKSNFSLTDTFEMIDGFHWASTSEAEAIFGNNANTSGIFTYYNQGGWSGYSFEGKTRVMFMLSDSIVTNKYKHAGNYDEYKLNTYADINSYAYKAGFVLIKDKVESIPEPSTLAIFALGVLGLAFRRNKKQA